jgi:hypothetical protein
VTGIASRVFTLLLAFATGAGTGFVLTFIHGHYVVELGGVPVPFGLVASLAIVAALLVGMRMAFAERAAPIAAAAGVIVGTAVLALPGNSGSLFLPDDPAGYVWAVGPTVLALVIIGWPQRRARVRVP